MSKQNFYYGSLSFLCVFIFIWNLKYKLFCIRYTRPGKERPKRSPPRPERLREASFWILGRCYFLTQSRMQALKGPLFGNAKRVLDFKTSRRCLNKNGLFFEMVSLKINRKIILFRKSSPQRPGARLVLYRSGRSGGPCCRS